MIKSNDERVEEDISVVDDTRDLISSDWVDVNRAFCTSFCSNESSSTCECGDGTHEFDTIFERRGIFIDQRDIQFRISCSDKSDAETLCKLEIVETTICPAPDQMVSCM